MQAGRLISGAWIALLAAASRGGGARWRRALTTLGSAEALLGASAARLGYAGLRRAEIARLRETGEHPPDDWKRWLDAENHALVTWGSEIYPPRLAEIPDPPLALWVDGSDVAALSQPQLAVVGSRHPTLNGRLAAERFAAALSRAGITVTSGLARGIDAASHRGALAGPGGTVAVLGNGIDLVYPATNRALAERIREHGVVVSEYAPGTPVRAGQFPERNRIIAGLALGTLVVEATRRSGSLITARLAAEFNREVFAVPGPVQSTLSKGCHQLIRDGAQLVEESGEILLELARLLGSEFDVDRVESSRADAENLPPELANCLDFSPIGFETLVSESGLTAAELSSMLLQLELQGKIEALPGGRYCRLAKRA